MHRCSMKLLLLLIVCSLAVSAVVSTHEIDSEHSKLKDGHWSNRPEPSNAIVTLLYGRDANFAKSAVALGRSLLAAGTTTPRILLYTDLTASQAKKLEQVGWTLRPIPAVENPSAHYVSRFDYIFSKLAIFGLEEFDRIVYLDADCVVTQRIDEMFSCNAQMCAVLRSAFFNAGVLVVTPSKKLYQTMMDKLTSTPADYPDNDQGFLNIFFWNPERCPFFDPTEDAPFPELIPCARLPNIYNGDLALYSFRSDRWLFDARTHSEKITPKIIHFTFGALKPWDWWTYTLVEQHWTWWGWFSQHRLFDSSTGVSVVQVLQLALLLPFPFLPVHQRSVNSWTLLLWASYMLPVFFGSVFYSLWLFTSPYTDWLVWLGGFLLPMDLFFRCFLTDANLKLTRLVVYSTFSVATAFLMLAPNNLLVFHLNFFTRLALMITVFCTIVCVFIPSRILLELHNQRRNKSVAP